MNIKPKTMQNKLSDQVNNKLPILSCGAWFHCLTCMILHDVLPY